jgi:hypothetical protein
VWLPLAVAGRNTERARASCTRRFVRVSGGFTRTCQQSEPADLRDRPGSVTQKEEAAGTPLSCRGSIQRRRPVCSTRSHRRTHSAEPVDRGQVGHTEHLTSEFGRSSPRFRSFPSGVRCGFLVKQHVHTHSVARCREMLRGFICSAFRHTPNKQQRPFV